MEAHCQIQMLGQLRVVHGEQSITRFRDRKTAALLAFLAYFRRVPHTRENLSFQFWPDSEEAAGRASLSTALNALHKQLEPSGVPRGTLLVVDRNSVQCRQDTCTTDVSTFEHALCQGNRHQDETERMSQLCFAVDQYSGDLLPGFYDDWILTERMRLQAMYLQTLFEIAATQEKVGQPRCALETTLRIVAADPLHEQGHTTLIRLYSALGDIDAARRQYQTLARILQKERGTLPDGALKRYWKVPITISTTSVLHGGGGRAAQMNLSPDKSVRHDRVTSLPIRLTRFFGRSQELVALRERIEAPDTRLITLAGSGGNGKTRLALEAAEQAAGRFDGNVWFVALGDITTPQQIPAAIRDALLLPRHPVNEPLDQVIEFLTNRSALLVLDNFEHLLVANTADGRTVSAEIVRTLLTRVSRLKCLVTSRQSLDIGGEFLLEVGPLPTPGNRQVGTEETPLLSSEASSRPFSYGNPSVRLFVDRAQSVNPNFQMTDRNALAITTLCDRLEGIPLALELAAARAQVLTPAQMICQLEAPFNFLASQRKDLPLRHQTLYKALDWSYRLLPTSLRDFFVRLSVFRGSWTIETAQLVACQETNNGEDTLSTLDCLDQLRHLSLLLSDEQDSAMRFRMLEMVRTFADVHLDPQERQRLRRRHAETFLCLAEEAESYLAGPYQVEWLHELEAETDNFRAALEWSIEQGESRLAMQLAGALGRFWNVRGHHREARSWYERIFALPGTERPTLHRARALRWAGYFGGFLKRDESDALCYQESLDIYRMHSDSPGTITMLGYVAQSHLSQHQSDEARRCYAEALEIAEHSGKWEFSYVALRGMAQFAVDEGDHETAIHLMGQALAISREQGDIRNTALTLQRLARMQNDPDKKSVLVEQALTLYRELGDVFGVAMSLRLLAGICQNNRKFEDAGAKYEESIVLFRQLQDRCNLTHTLCSMAYVRYLLGDVAGALLAIDEALQFASETERSYMGDFLAMKAWILLANGTVPEASDCLHNALQNFTGRQNAFRTAGILVVGAELIRRQQRPKSAVNLLGKAASLYNNFHQPDLTCFHQQFRILVQQLVCELPEVEYSLAFEAGYELSIDNALVLLHSI